MQRCILHDLKCQWDCFSKSSSNSKHRKKLITNKREQIVTHTNATTKAPASFRNRQKLEAYCWNTKKAVLKPAGKWHAPRSSNLIYNIKTTKFL